jgi:Protein of unknown function (DUF2815)
MTTEHIAILTHHSLDIAVKNKLKAADKAPEFYGLIAFPPAAANDLMAVTQAAAGSEPLSNFEIGIKTNALQKTPIPGIPADWFVVRAATQFAPYVADATGAQLEQGDPEHVLRIKSEFYAGKRVRASITGYAWNFKGKRGISYNLAGVMDAGQAGERLAIGNGDVVNAFQKFAQPAAQLAATASPFGVAATAPVEAAPAASANPFAQAAPAAQTNNPFATA